MGLLPVLTRGLLLTLSVIPSLVSPTFVYAVLCNTAQKSRETLDELSQAGDQGHPYQGHILLCECTLDTRW